MRGKEESRGVLIVTEGLAQTVIDSQVLMHAARMRDAGIADFSVVALACDEIRHRESIKRAPRAREIAGGEVMVLRGVRPVRPHSARTNAGILAEALSHLASAPEILHARTDYAAVVASHLPSRARFALVWDCRGDGVAEVQALHRGGPLGELRSRLAARIAARRAAFARDASDAAIFVTASLRDRYGRADRPSAVIPCLASSRHFRHDVELGLRTRAELGFATDDLVVVYCGSLTPYQCLPESIDVVRRSIASEQKLKLLIVTPEVERARALAGALPDAFVRVLRAEIGEVNACLNAADLALLLRRDDAINRGAFPTKFAEYCLTGLPVVFGGGLPECRAVASELGLGLDLTTEGTIPAVRRTVAERSASATAAASRLSAESRVDDYREIYRVARRIGVCDARSVPS